MRDHPLPILEITPVKDTLPDRKTETSAGWTASMPPLRVTIASGDLSSLEALRAAALRVANDRSEKSSFPVCWEEAQTSYLKGAYHDLLRVAEELDRAKPPGPALGKVLRDAVPGIHAVREIQTPRGELRFEGSPLLMGVLNVTPDSFSDGGLYLDPKAAVDRAWKLVEEGADILDLGAESTRPGSEQVPTEVELKRLVPVLREIALDYPVPISVDTYKAQVAEIALGEGADMVNDVSGLTFDPPMASVVARHGVPIILMHMRGRPKTMQYDPRYRWLVADIIEGLALSVERAVESGVSEEMCLIDPGLGFGKTFAHNEELIEAIPLLRKVGQPIVVGPSRKAFIKARWGGSPDALAEGTAAVCCRAAALGASLLRVHDVGVIRRALEKEMTRRCSQE
jgi:dihydropteroate synthase